LKNKSVPFLTRFLHFEIEVRQVFEAEDFGAELTPELREQEERLRAQSEQRKKTAKK